MIKATSALAGAKVITILISIIRTKVMAMLMGPGGIGVVALVSSSVDLARVLFAFGLDSATVRKVAETSTGSDPVLLDQAYRIAARTAIFIGSLACAVFAIASPFLSARFFGNTDYFWWFGIAGCSLAFTPLLGVQLAFLQGLKRSQTLAICQIIASIAGAILTISLVVMMGKTGAIIALLPVSVISLLIHLHFLKKHRPIIHTPRPYNQLHEAKNLLKLGSGFAINGIWLTASGWLNNVFIKSYYGLDIGVLQVGYYGASATLANFYIGIIVSAMATEFYPSLVQAANDRKSVNRLLNQQTMLSIGIGIPGTLVLLVLSPWLLSVLYTKEFSPGSDLMRWMLASMAIRFATCPLGIVLLAVGSPRMIAFSELGMGIVMIATSYIMLQMYGLSGIGMAMAITNLLQLAGLLWVSRRLGVVWNARTIRIVILTMAVVACSLAICTRIEHPARYPTALLLIGAHALYIFGIIRHDTGIRLADITNRIFKRN